MSDHETSPPEEEKPESDSQDRDLSPESNETAHPSPEDMLRSRHDDIEDGIEELEADSMQDLLDALSEVHAGEQSIDEPEVLIEQESSDIVAPESEDEQGTDQAIAEATHATTEPELADEPEASEQEGDVTVVGASSEVDEPAIIAEQEIADVMDVEVEVDEQSASETTSESATELAEPEVIAEQEIGDVVATEHETDENNDDTAEPELTSVQQLVEAVEEEIDGTQDDTAHHEDHATLDLQAVIANVEDEVIEPESVSESEESAEDDGEPSVDVLVESEADENEVEEPASDVSGDDPTLPPLPPSQVETLDIEEVPQEDDDVPFHLPVVARQSDDVTLDIRKDAAQMVTMPVYQEDQFGKAEATLVGDSAIPAVQPEQSQFAPPTSKGANPQNTIVNPQVAVPPSKGSAPPPPPGEGKRNLPRRRRRRRILGMPRGCFFFFIALMLTFCGGTVLVTGAIAAIAIPPLEEQWTEQVEQVDTYRSFESTFYYDRYGNLLFEDFGEGRRTRVTYDRFPQYLIDATIAIEDDSFFTNLGIDFAATFVAFTQYVGAAPDENTPGGSTITQQLVRNVLFDFEKRAERSVERKAEEIILAMLLTQRKSKEDILELYLNEIYYGNLAYGAQTAAQTFFGKDVGDLTIGEAALLAGLPQAPASLDPLSPDPEVQIAVDQRWRQVLNEMVEEGFITDAERNQALSQGLTFIVPDAPLNAPHFTVYAQGELERLMTRLGYSPEEITRGGLEVYTTIDQGVNDLALQAARSQVATLQSNNVSNAAVFVMKPLTGEILGMVGSIDYNSNVIDGRVNVTTAFRQPGSTMKPFTYSAALERGLSPADVLWDTPTSIGIPGQPAYVPRNYDGTFHGPMILRRALANSYNIPAVQTLRLVGVDYLLSLLQRFGVETIGTDASRYGLSLTLGGGEITLVELTNAYSVFANQGSYVPTTSILCVINSDGDVIYQYENSCPEGRVTGNTIDVTGFGSQVLDPRIAYLVTDILSDNAARTPAMGSNSALRTDGIQTSVKTGTTNDVKDNWTVGYTRNVAVGVWVGNNDGQPMVNSSGLTGAAPIWNTVMSGIYQNPAYLNAFAVGGQLLSDQPNPPPGMSLRQVCDVRRVKDPAVGCPGVANEWLLDSPAGIPDGQGGLQYPPNDLQSQQPPDGSQLREVSPGIYSALAFPLPPQVANGIQFQLAPGDSQPVPPKYCRVPSQLAGQAQAQGAQELVFIAGPSTSQPDAVAAERYAQQQGFAYLPTIECWQDVLQAAPPVAGPQVLTAVISSPTPGQIVSNDIPIIGTVQFSPDQASFYKIELIGGPFANWTTAGNTHNQPVVNGQLETLGASGLPPGNYQIRLVVINSNGDIVQQPYTVSFIKS